ncbi:MAG: caspase family protein [Armatimonadetes bacterium]|nr:caspase family protein [Armatimonadota bacterium]
MISLVKLSVALLGLHSAQVQVPDVVYKGMTIYTRQHALLIGTGPGPARGTEGFMQDAREWRKVLTESYGYRESEATLLDGAAASRANIDAWFESAKKFGKNDAVIIVVSAHTSKNDKDEAFLELSGASGEADLYSYAELNRKLAQIPSKHVAMVLDTCYAAKIYDGLGAVLVKGGSILSDDLVRQYAESGARMIATSTSAGDISLSDGSALSLFSGELLGYLKNEAKSSGPVLLGDAVDFLSRSGGQQGRVVSWKDAGLNSASLGRFMLFSSATTAPGSASNRLYVDMAELRQIGEEVINLVDSSDLHKNFLESKARQDLLASVRKIAESSGAWQVQEYSARLFYALCSSEEALRCADAATKLVPSSGEALIVRVGTYAYLGNFVKAREVLEAYLSVFGRNPSSIRAEHILVDYDPRYPAEISPWYKYARQNPSCQAVASELFNHELSIGRFSYANELLISLNVRFGLSLDQATAIAARAANVFGLSKLCPILLDALNSSGATARQIFIDKVTLQFLSMNHEAVLETAMPKGSTRKAEVSILLLQAVALARMERFSEMHNKLLQAEKVASEAPREIDSISVVKGAFPDSVFKLIRLIHRFDPERCQLDAKADPDGFVRDQSIIAEVAFDKIMRIFGRSSLFVVLELGHLLNRSVGKTEVAKASGAESGDVTGMILKSASHDGEHAGAVRVLRCRARMARDKALLIQAESGRYVPTEKESLEADIAVITNLEFTLSLPQFVDRLSSIHRSFFIQMLEHYKGSRPDDYILMRVLISLYKADGKSRKADETLAEAKSRWDWFKP